MTKPNLNTDLEEMCRAMMMPWLFVPSDRQQSWCWLHEYWIGQWYKKRCHRPDGMVTCCLVFVGQRNITVNNHGSTKGLCLQCRHSTTHEYNSRFIARCYVWVLTRFSSVIPELRHWQWGVLEEYGWMEDIHSLNRVEKRSRVREMEVQRT